MVVSIEGQKGVKIWPNGEKETGGNGDLQGAEDDFDIDENRKQK